MCLKELLNFLVRSDRRLFQTGDLLLDGFFFPDHVFILLIRHKADLMSDPAKSEVRIVLAKEQTIFCSRCHHTVRLMVLFRDKIIDQNPDIRLGTVKDHCTLLLQLSRRVDAGHEALNGSFLVSGASVKLAAGE